MKRLQSKGGRTGVWIAGAKGDIASTLMVGAHAIRRGLADTTGLTSELPPLDRLGLVPLPDLVFGGADISDAPLRQSAESLYTQSRTVSREVLDAVAADLEATESNILVSRQLAWGRGASGPASLADTAGILCDALRQFRFREGLERLVVVNLSSVEPEPVTVPEHQTLEGLESLIATDRRDAVTPGILFAYAALKEGCAYINFTPNAGPALGAIRELAERNRLPFYGNDGKTGETLVKTALAPLFACRNLRVLSWEGVNMLGNNDGRALDVPDNRVAKLRNKGRVLESMLGYEPHGQVQINYVPSLGDWKTAWDLIHFQGFLDVKMSMQFTWQGCDSILAAPLVLDMVRLADFALRKGEWGPMRHLAAFFKSPLDEREMALWPQFRKLLEYAQSHLSPAQAAPGKGYAARR